MGLKKKVLKHIKHFSSRNNLPPSQGVSSGLQSTAQKKPQNSLSNYTKNAMQMSKQCI